MDVELISVGTELLLGNIVNTNAHYLSNQCADMGFSSYYQVTVGDNFNRFYETLKYSIKRSDLIIITGGLGPTTDDITKEVVAKVLGRKMIDDQHSRERIISYFNSRNKTNKKDEKNQKNNKWGFTDNNWRQSMKIEGSIVVDNNCGTAPGTIVEDEQGIFVLLPGPPHEMKAMFEESIVPYLAKHQDQVFYSNTVKLFGIGESLIETELMDLIEKQTNPTIATYGTKGEIHIRLTAAAQSIDQAKKIIKPILHEIEERFPCEIFTTENNKTLDSVVVDLLKKNKLIISTAESCTGGLLSGRITSVAGASDIFNEGFITYANTSKIKYLDVKEKTLGEFGAVSGQVAEEMVLGLATRTRADISIAITGNAGPDAISSKPVGLVYISCRYKGKTTTVELNINGDRNKVRAYTTTYALNLIRKTILDL